MILDSKKKKFVLVHHYEVGLLTGSEAHENKKVAVLLQDIDTKVS